MEKLHGVKFDITYDNRNVCADFIRYISQSLFDINVKSKLKIVNFIAVLRDRATDAAIIEKECVFVLFVDLDDFPPSMTFFSLKDVASQDAKEIETAVRHAFAGNDLSCFFQVMVPMQTAV